MTDRYRAVAGPGKSSLVRPRSQYANKPIELPARMDAIKGALQQALQKRRDSNV